MRLKHKAELIRVLTDFVEGCDSRMESIEEQLSEATGDREDKLSEQEGVVSELRDLAQDLSEQLEASDDV